MSCFLQTSGGDLDLSSGNLVVVDDLATETAQKLNNLFGMNKGEWYADERQGVPYFEAILVKDPNPTVIQSVITQTAQYAPAVASIPSIDLQLDANRNLEVNVQAQLDDGTVLTGGPGRPFVVTTSAAGAGPTGGP